MAWHFTAIRMSYQRHFHSVICATIQVVVFAACVFAAGRIWSLHIARPHAKRASVVRSDPAEPNRSGQFSDPSEHDAPFHVCLKDYPKECCCE